MAKPIDMSFGLWTRVGPRNHGLDGVSSPVRRGNFEGEMERPTVKYRDSLP